MLRLNLQMLGILCSFYKFIHSFVDAATTMYVGGWTIDSLLPSYLFVELIKKILGKNYFCINFAKLAIEPVTA